VIGDGTAVGSGVGRSFAATVAEGVDSTGNVLVDVLSIAVKPGVDAGVGVPAHADMVMIVKRAKMGNNSWRTFFILYSYLQL